MKTEKGITLISLTIYIIAMTIVVAILAVISTFFYKNTTDIKDVEPIAQYTAFNSYFSEEVNTPDIKVLDCQENYIVFDNGVQYTFIKENNAIYKNKVKICTYIEECTFEQGKNSNDKITVTVNLKAKNDDTINRQPIVYTLK